MTFTWYKIFNKAEFESTGLVSRELSVTLEGVGNKTFLITKGNLLSMTVDEVMLSLGITSETEFVFGIHGMYLDPAGDVWYGIAA